MRARMRAQARKYSTAFRMLSGEIAFSKDEILEMLGIDRELSLRIHTTK